LQEAARYLDTFVEVALKGDYATAIEAFTVIEVAVGDLGQDQREKHVKAIKSSLPGMDEHKKNLLKELIRVIENY